MAARHAVVNVPVIARQRPSRTARRVGRLTMLTEDRTTELALVLARTTDKAGRTWLKVRLPIRTCGYTAEQGLPGARRTMRTPFGEAT